MDTAAMEDELVADFGIASPQVSAAAAFVILILSGFSAPHCGATVYYSDGSAASVQALHNAAHDGDTITVPDGTFSWTARLNITKGITIRGNTTIQNAGKSNASASDNTNIIDNVTNRTGVIIMQVPAGKVATISGLTFARGLATGPPQDQGVIMVDSPSHENGKGNRITSCHFVNYVMDTGLFVINGYGVMDHCFFEIGAAGGTQVYAFVFHEDNYGPAGAVSGSGAWADYPWYGTDKFFFIEDCTVIRANEFATVDGLSGGRSVIRHCYFNRGTIGGHGTEGGGRGIRAREVYNNVLNAMAGPASLNARSGTQLIHDNLRTGTNPSQVFSQLNNVRTITLRAFPVWGTADGTSPWDMNVTDVNPADPYNKNQQTFVEAHQHTPYLFESGQAVEASVTSPGVATVKVDKTFTPGILVKYGIRNVDCSTCRNGNTDTASMASTITANTSNTITYTDSFEGQSSARLRFAVGDHFQIHRVMEMMDECGHGKTDYITGASSSTPINTTTGTASYAHSQIEAVFSWNNVNDAGTIMTTAARPTDPVSQEHVDVFNLGKDLVGTPTQVSDHYTAARNGVDYTGTFTYPHPLVTGASTPTPSATPRSQQHLQKKKKNSKKLKRRNWPKKSASDMAERLARGSHLVTARRCSHGAVRRLGNAALNDANAPAGAWLQHLLERFYCVASELKARCTGCGGSCYCRRRTGRCCDPKDQYMRAIVSTLIPAYYAEEWVGAAIGSALGPIWRQKENIVVDHGSTDGTLAGARQFESDEVRGGKQPTQEPAAASIPSAGDKANPAELKDDSET
jgi:hypothetical protein